MVLARPVVWKEGIFISPQHFQQQDRFNRLHLQQYVREYCGEGNQYGFTELEINYDLLKIGKFSLMSAKGFFSDGHFFELDSELVLQIPETAVNSKIFLTLPLAIKGAQHYGEQGEKQTRGICKTVTVFDSTSIQQDSIEIEVATDNLGLSLDSQDLSGVELLPIARILEISDSGLVVLDESFQPAAMQVRASGFLREKNKMLHSLLWHRAEQVFKRIQADQGDKSEQSLMKEHMWLQILNRWLPWADGLIQDDSYSTFRLYAQLSMLCAELGSLTPELADKTEPFQVDRQYSLFNPLYQKLKNLLSLAFHASVTTFQWDRQLFEKRRLLRTVIKQPEIMRGRRFVMAVESAHVSNQLDDMLPVSVTLAGKSSIVELVRNAMSGIVLTPLAVVPEQLKPMQDYHYFDVDIHHDLWTDMLDKGETLHMHVNKRIADLNVLMYAI